MRLLWPPLGGRAYTHSHVAGTSRTSVSITQSTILVASLCHVSMRPAAKVPKTSERASVCSDYSPHSLVHTHASGKACVSVRARGEGCRFITMADDEPPALQAASSSEAGILTPRSGQELAASAGRSVDAFNVILMSQATESEGRQVVFEVADHGISMRDPYGALLKVVPLEYITGWKSDAQNLVLMISKDLETFYRMRCQTNDGPAIEAALTKAAKVSAPHLARAGQACVPSPRAARCRAVVSRRSAWTTRRRRRGSAARSGACRCLRPSRDSRSAVAAAPPPRRARPSSIRARSVRARSPPLARASRHRLSCAR